MNEFRDLPEQQSQAPPVAGPGGPNGPSDREVYNIVTDTVVGPNVRWRDNMIQAAITAGGLVLGVPGGWLYAKLNGWNENDQMGCAIVGGFLGLVVGLFGSGIFLMVYRGMRHIRGKHD
jgi:hypothetical protein